MMQRLLNTGRFVALAFVAVTAFAPTLATPLAAQQSTAGTAFKVLVKDLDNKSNPKDNKVGAKIAELVRKGMSTMATHTPIPAKDVLAEMKKLNVTPEAFDCTSARQISARLSAKIVMCGDYE